MKAFGLSRCGGRPLEVSSVAGEERGCEDLEVGRGERALAVGALLDGRSEVYGFRRGVCFGAACHCAL